MRCFSDKWLASRAANGRKPSVYAPISSVEHCSDACGRSRFVRLIATSSPQTSRPLHVTDSQLRLATSRIARLASALLAPHRDTTFCDLRIACFGETTTIEDQLSSATRYSSTEHLCSSKQTTPRENTITTLRRAQGKETRCGLLLSVLP